ncbi:MAG: acyl carrier protein [Cyanobacteria bacterium P01_F01_bin.86]
MTIEEVKVKAQKVVLTMLADVDETELSDDKDIFSLGLDSINAMSLVFSLQDEFDIQFETSEISFENFRTIEDITNLIGKKKDL